MIPGWLRRLLGLRPGNDHSATNARADATVERADRVLAEFRRTEEAMRGKPRVP